MSLGFIMRIVILWLWFALCAFVGPVVADTSRGFQRFIFQEASLPGSHWVADDPTGNAPAPRVDVFSLKPGPCSRIPHPNGHNDCTYGSLRTQMREDARSQPREVWAAWSMYLPPDFPVGKGQAGQGMYTFAYFHNSECPNVALISDTSNTTKLYLQTNLLGQQGDYTCLPDQRIAIADLGKLRGAWHRIEMHVVFSEGDDGVAQVYLDGKLAADYRGHTITLRAKPSNYFVYGIYLCCTIGADKITPAWALYSDLAKGTTRDFVAP